MRRIIARTEDSKHAKVAATLKIIYAQEPFEANTEKASAVSGVLEKVRLKEAAKRIRSNSVETLPCAHFPLGCQGINRTANAIERVNRRLGSALISATDRPKYATDGEWKSKSYLGVTPLDQRQC